MNKICPQCRYARKPDETVPDWQCPNCSVVYQKFGAINPRVADTKVDDASGIKWWHALLSAVVSPIVVGALWKMHFTSHPILLGLFLFGVVWAMLHRYTGGGDSSKDGSDNSGWSDPPSGNDSSGSDGGDSGSGD